MTLNKKKLVTNIIFYTLIVIIYGFVIFQVIVKFNGGIVYIFDNRVVVLTKSMSTKNENHLDFLEGTTQIQAYDLVQSKKINEDTELKLKDVVLFKSPDLGGKTVMHRIAEIVQKSDTLSIYNSKQYDFNNIKTISLDDYNSYIGLSNESLKSIEIDYLSKEENLNVFAFNYGGEYKPSEGTSIKIDNYYKNTVISYSESKADKPSRICPSSLATGYITSIRYTTNSGKTFEYVAESYTGYNPEEIYETPVNVVDYYKLRGDAAKDFDNNGIEFARADLISKVENVIPKMGYVVSFLSSIPGIILLVGLAIIITVTSYFYNRIPKTKVVENVAEVSLEDNNTEENKEAKEREELDEDKK